MNICFFIQNLSFPGGTERISIALANVLSENPAYQVNMLSLESFDSTFFPLKNNITTASLHLSSTDIRKTYLKAVMRLRKYINQNQMDVLIDVDVILSAISLPATVFTKTKVISWEHFNYFTKAESVVRRIARKLAARYSAAVVTLTEQDVAFYKENCKVKTKIIAIPNFVEEFPAVSYDKAQKIVLAVGRLEQRKGFNLLIHSWIWGGRESEIRKDWKLLIVGSGEEKENLERQIRESKAEASIEILPPTRSIQDYYQKASIYVLTSRAEGLPMVLIEAQSHGLPTIAFDCKTGPREIISDGEDGFLIPCFDTDLYAEKLTRLMQDVSLRQTFSRNAVKNRERFSVSKAVEKWEKLLSNDLS